MTTLVDYISKRLTEFGRITQDRRPSLERLATLIAGRRATSRDTKVVFVCTHNSRRSQLAQVWATAAVHHFAIAGIDALSAGTRATEVDRRAIETLERAGFTWTQSNGHNPTYTVRVGSTDQTLPLFSKTLSDSFEATTDFIAVITCSNADLACPVIEGASDRLSLSYDDPRAADGSSYETDIYDECCRSISREMLYVFSKTKTQLTNSAAASRTADNHAAR